MAEYQVFARKYRPQRFAEVIGQDAMITTLKNAVRSGRLAQAYLFSGSRGTGKTTTARILAKALNCPNAGDDCEPCNQCPSCKEITEGHSLNVLEVDGASHRGIEDIRQINETAGYAAASGNYKIYIIDEVHMLTKEAFNALLKTLEEPPPKVKFFFATTEPHKVPATILSRCQRFALNRISNGLIVEKLQEISRDVSVKVEEEALLLIANLADGGLRDAESLLDQVYSFHNGDITEETVAAVLGVVARDIYFSLDTAGRNGDLAKAFEIVGQVFSEGKNLIHFVEGLVEHFRNLLLVIVSGADAPYLNLSENERAKYTESAKLYRKEQCMDLMDYLLDAQQKIRFAPSLRIALEGILLRIIRSHKRIPVEVLVRKLAELQQIATGAEADKPDRTVHSVSQEAQSSVLSVPHGEAKKIAPSQGSIATAPSASGERVREAKNAMSADDAEELRKNQSRYDTVLQFAAVELEGTVQKKR